MTSVGSITIGFGGDPRQLEATQRRVAAALGATGKNVDNLRQQMSRASVEWENASGRMAAKTTTLTQRVKGFQEGMSKTSAALSSLSSAMGHGESKAAKWGQAMVGIAGAFAAGGPIGGAVAVAGAGFEALTAHMAAAEKKTNDLLASFDRLVDKFRNSKDVTAGLLSDQKFRTDVNRSVGAMRGRGDSEESIEVFRRGAPIERERKQKEAALMALQEKAWAATGAQAMELEGAMANLSQELRDLQRLSLGIGAEVRAERRAAGQTGGPKKASNGPDAYDSYLATITAEQDAAMYGWRGLGDSLEDADLGVSALSLAFEKFDDTAKVSTADLEREARRRQEAIDQNIAAMEAEAFRRRETDAAMAASLATAVLSGQGGAALGQMGGSVIGAALGPAAGIDPLTGGALGGVLGSLFGGLIDKLDPVIAIVETLMGGAGDLVAGLAPLFRSMIPQAAALAAMLGALAPVVSSLLEPFVAYQGVVTEILEAAVPLVIAVADMAVSINRWIPISKTLVFIFEEISHALGGLHDRIVNLLNDANIIGLDNLKTDDENSGASTAAEINAENAANDAETQNNLLAFIEEQKNATKENTEALKEFNQSFSNIPTGYRVPMYDSEAANGKGNTTIFEIGQVVISAKNPDLERVLAEGLMKKRGKSLRSVGRDIDDTN